jgi:hypothetical protein
MPLVVPGIQSKDGKGEDWTTKLMGKSLGDAHNETVSRLHIPLEGGSSCTTACPLYPFPCACRACGETVLIRDRRLPSRISPRSTACLSLVA